MLENDEARQQLIDHLRRQAAEEQALGQAEPTALTISFPRQLAELTSRVASDIGGEVRNLGGILSSLFSAGTDATAFDMAAFTTAAINLGLVIIATFVLFMLFRHLSRPLFGRLSLWSRKDSELNPTLRLVLCVALAAVVDLLVVALAYVAGNLIATFAIGETGELSTRASLFLNAFLIIELIKAALRMLFSSRYEGYACCRSRPARPPTGTVGLRAWSAWSATV